MDGSGEDEPAEGTVQLLARRQRREKRELQAKIQGMKNAVPKNDKKRRKQLADDVAKLEAELEQKHKEELEQLKENLPDKNKIDSVADGVASLELDGSEQQIQQPRISKAQKRREKKAALEKKREERIAEAEIENLTGARHLESQKLAHILAARQLAIKQIPSDGHCMYRAIEDQLKDCQNSWTVAALRNQTAKYMQNHVDDFLPFLTNPNTGDVYSREEFAKYCDDIANTAAWGGQLELRALSHILQTPIEVVQVDSPPIIVGEEYSGKPIILVYMRHAYGLGEHYNSVKLLTDTAIENGS
ncbi:deubiquitinase OTUD6B [Alligator mississippiensis]|uniref:ubiquitinyl hydrolase 1 n=1 Tax=Alligator mississippiensis TaxID=8496 RepID=A0A151PGP3_ALLMI|nr:deubiquitinase OTUD6B [Alligator mississippiensis]KYO48297.1 OTU domain-containing protein 6B [Alligator mississippiensis]